MDTKIFIINGPNLNLLGRRENDIYGNRTLADIEILCKEKAESFPGASISFFQSNSESEIIGLIQQALDEASAIIINPAGYTHTSVAILDALRIFNGPVVEVHLSDIAQRESFRKFSYVSARADKVIKGKGPEGYIEALDFLASKLSKS